MLGFKCFPAPLNKERRERARERQREREREREREAQRGKGGVRHRERRRCAALCRPSMPWLLVKSSVASEQPWHQYVAVEFATLPKTDHWGGRTWQRDRGAHTFIICGWQDCQLHQRLRAQTVTIWPFGGSHVLAEAVAVVVAVILRVVVLGATEPRRKP